MKSRKISVTGILHRDSVPKRRGHVPSTTLFHPFLPVTNPGSTGRTATPLVWYRGSLPGLTLGQEYGKQDSSGLHPSSPVPFKSPEVVSLVVGVEAWGVGHSREWPHTDGNSRSYATRVDRVTDKYGD